jgi:hypothetical protein
MSIDHEKRTPVAVPATEKWREVLRAAVEAIASFIPGGSALARLYRTIHPPKSEQDRKQWQATVSERTNENTDRLDQHENLLSPKATVVGVAAKLAAVLAHDCPDGMHSKSYALTDLYALLPHSEKQAVEDAAFELKSFGLVEVRRTLGTHWWLQLCDTFYEQIDRQVMGWNTVEDAVTLANS